MFEHLSQEQLLENALDMVSNNVDRREGAIIWDALSPHTIQLYELYLAMDGMLREMFGDTASRAFLIRLALERGIVPYPATKAILKGVFNIDIPIGSRFSLDELNYVAIQKISEGVYQMESEMEGYIGNSSFGTLIPINYIDGLTSAELVELLIPGEDEESTESLRKRYLESFDALAFGGNRKDYHEKVHKLQGVGGVKIYRVREGIYNVKLVVMDANYDSPSLTLLDNLQTAIDPVTNQGEGIGLAPIGHTVLIVGAEKEEIGINFPTLVLDDELEWEDVQLEIIQKIDSYFLELKKEWEESTQLVIRIAQLESRILEISGVIDVQDTTINGVASNFILDENAIPERGDVTNV